MRIKMKLISLSAFGVLADNSFRQRIKQSQKMKAVTGNFLCQHRPGLQCFDGYSTEFKGCDPVLQGKQCGEDHFDFVGSECYCDLECITYNDCCADHATTCMTLYENNQAEISEEISFELLTLLETLELVFKVNKEGGRPHLQKKWTKMIQKWNDRFVNLTSSGCVFEDKTIGMTISNTNDACKVI